MKRKVTAVLAIIALVTCVGRISTWKDRGNEVHQCCRGESSTPVKGPVLAECCATPAVGGAIGVVRTALTAILVQVPILRSTAFFYLVSDDHSAPPSPLALHFTVPARAPPLA